MNTEYVIWGIPKGDYEETILFTKCDTLKEANYMCNHFEDVFKATQTRVQIIDFSKPLENSFNLRAFLTQGFPKDGDYYE